MKLRWTEFLSRRSASILCVFVSCIEKMQSKNVSKFFFELELEKSGGWLHVGCFYLGKILPVKTFNSMYIVSGALLEYEFRNNLTFFSTMLSLTFRAYPGSTICFIFKNFDSNPRTLHLDEQFLSMPGRYEQQWKLQIFNPNYNAQSNSRTLSQTCSRVSSTKSSTSRIQKRRVYFAVSYKLSKQSENHVSA